MDIEKIKAQVRVNQYVYTHHAEIERRADELTFAQVEEALLNGEILEQYPDTGRGESCLVVGFAEDVPIHAVCGWRGEKVALITVYIPRPPKLLTPGHEERGAMRKVQCNFCGRDRYEERRIEYLYSYKGEYLLVPNTPVEVCLNCGMVYYDAAVLKEIERRFFAIQHKAEKPDRYIEMPAMAYA